MDKEKCIKILTGVIMTGENAIKKYTEGEHKERYRENIDGLIYAKKIVMERG